jgi:hypothetical protein
MFSRRPICGTTVAKDATSCCKYCRLYDVRLIKEWMTGQPPTSIASDVGEVGEISGLVA